MTPARRCRCGTSLAQDNAGALCAACQQKPSRTRAPEVPSDFWHTDAMTAALASGDLGQILRAYPISPFHGRRPLSQTVVADWLHVSQTSLSRIEQGKCRLTIDEISGFARTLGLSIAVRCSPLHDTGDDVDLSRRSLFGAGAGAALGLNATTAPAAAREIDPDLALHWMALLRLLDNHDAMCGPRDVLDGVCHEINLIAGHRKIAQGELRMQLLGVEARWSHFASWLSYDTGDVAHRDYWSERALRLAQEADQPDLVAWVLMRRSRWAVEQHDAQRAIAFAEAADRVGGISDHIRALCALRLAQGRAVARETDACERSLAAAHDLLDRASAADTPDLCRVEVTSAWVMGDDARCWLRLQPRKAIPMFEEVLRLLPPERIRKRGVHQAHLAMACAAASEPERAAIEGMTALNVAQAIRSDVIVRRLARLDRHLAGFDVPAAADFREVFATL